MKKLRVLVACEFSGIVRDAFAARGHDAWSCDLLPSESQRIGNKHIQDVVRGFNNMRIPTPLQRIFTAAWPIGLIAVGIVSVWSVLTFRRNK